ncbi:aldehyde dehydrogenase family protein [Chondrinema litorale]|uniref:aldehyde dehydrogenase family protein n=1 Tax=Chondrinema litorale TaxID=2994555 RepID=UPI0025432433|nr:aldehyde dehydrogenase family protein [Chondrinema litorale]UZR95559.1 aldehyde dehydrogenase family protein [Chondrinema litorale]
MDATTNNLSINTQVSQVFSKQLNRYHKHPNPSYKERLTNLKKLEAVVLKYREDIQEAIYQDFKKNHVESDFLEVLPTVLEVRHAIKKLKKWMKPKNAGMPLALFGTKSRIITEPKGVCLIIAPWNYPFILAISPLIYALAAGNNVILKPSEITTHTSALMKKMIAETFREEHVTVIEGDVQTATELLEKPFNHIFFTGSPVVGKIVMKAAAQHLSSITLELGGKSPVIIDESADVNDAAEKITWGKLINNGQTCISPDYLLIHKDKKAEFVQNVKSRINQFYNQDGKGVESSNDYCRIINEKHYQRVSDLIGDALDRGAVLEEGGNTNSESNYIAPTLLSNVTLDTQIMEDEIFGPVLPIITYDHIDEAIKIIRSKEKPLSLYIFSKSKKAQKYILKNTSAGGTAVNDVILHIAHNDLPFGGVNNSGIGKSHGKYGYLAFSNERAVLYQRIGLTSAKPFYPPYDSKVKKMIDLLLKWL